MVLTFNDFKKKCEAEGMDARECTEFHWQIFGGKVLLNFYPTKGTAYAQGAVKAMRWSTIDQAIRFAKGDMPEFSRQKARRKVYASAKRRMLKKDPFCFYCRCDLSGETATVDHVIPLSRGGSNRADNLKLACKGCNQDKGSDM